MPEPVILIANGDLRLAANQKCWPAQARAEEAVIEAIRARRPRGAARPSVRCRRSSTASSTARSAAWRCFAKFRRTRRSWWSRPSGSTAIIVLHGLYTHRGPILTVANWSGEWPGLVGMLNLNGSLTKAGVKYSSLWSVDFTDDFFLTGLRRWLAGQPVKHDTSHVHPLDDLQAAGARGKNRQRAGRRLPPQESHPGRVRRRLHGHVQRHHSRRAAASRPASSRSGSASRPSTPPCSAFRRMKRSTCAHGWTRAACNFAPAPIRKPI